MSDEQQGIKFRAHVMCPYCGKENGYWLYHTSTWGKHEVVYCDVEHGGCDNPFVVNSRPVLKVESLAIVGIEADA